MRSSPSQRRSPAGARWAGRSRTSRRRKPPARYVEKGVRPEDEQSANTPGRRDNRAFARRAANTIERRVDRHRRRPRRTGGDPRLHPSKPTEPRRRSPVRPWPPSARGGAAVRPDSRGGHRFRLRGGSHSAAAHGRRPGTPEGTSLSSTARMSAPAGKVPRKTTRKPKAKDPEVTATKATEPTSPPVVEAGPVAVHVESGDVRVVVAPPSKGGFDRPLFRAINGLPHTR